MKKRYKTGLAVVAVLVVAYACLPYYARQALIYWYPDIDDLTLFERDTLRAADSCWQWPAARDYNAYQMPPADERYLDSMRTVAFLVIQHDSVVYEEYRDGWNDTLTSNLYSATKSIVSFLVGIAWGEGKIGSIDDPVGKYIPAFREGRRGEVTIRHLLTMSAGLSWDESYSSLFSVTTQGYYGNNLYELVTGLDVVREPGRQFLYCSGETQLLAFVVEAATGRSLADYAEEKLWRSVQASNNAYWLLDKAKGDEKAFCCFHTTARDVARLARLMLHDGTWEGRQVVPREYMREAIRPASYLLDEWGRDSLDYYGFQVWQLHYRGQVIPYFRGMLGQYIYALPDRDAIVVRLGHRQAYEYIREANVDIYRYMDIATRVLDARRGE